MSKIIKPTIILVRPQLGDNIGTAARAMLNFGLTDLRLVAPRQGWDMARALKAAAGADMVIENRQEFASTAEAVADLNCVIATTARPRDMVKTMWTPEKVAGEIIAHANKGEKTGLLYGPERTGLNNDDISLSDAICRVPVNPEFSSLNLAQAVLLTGYIWYRAHDETPDVTEHLPDTRRAERGELTGMFAHLENALHHAGFLSPPEKKPAMMRNIRNMLLRADMTEQDIRTFRGIINALLRWPRDGRDSELRQRVLAISKGEVDPIASEVAEESEKSPQ